MAPPSGGGRPLQARAALRLGLLFRPNWPPEELVAFARAAERDGFDELWVVEDCFWAGGLTMAATALAVTERIAVGIGLLPVVMRNPAIAAMEISGLARAHPRRLIAAFGHGVEEWMRQIGARPPNRLVALEETVDAVRRLLAGETLRVDGGFVHLDDVRLGHVPREPPRLLIGTTGPRALEIAGRASDGFLLPEACGPAALRWASAAAGVPGSVYAWLSIDDDRDAAAEALLPGLEARRRSGRYDRLFDLAGVDSVGPDAARAMAVAGDSADCAAGLRALGEAGAESVVLVPREGDAAEQVARFVGDVMPRLTS